MARIIEQANSAYEQRDIAQEKLATLIQQAERDQVEYEKQMNTVSNLLEKDKQIQQFLKTQEQEKAILERFDHGADEEEARMPKPEKTQSRDQTQTQMEQVERFREAFAKIEAATGIDDIDRLVSTFIKAEENNFALFRFVNDLSNEIEAAETQI